MNMCALFYNFQHRRKHVMNIGASWTRTHISSFEAARVSTSQTTARYLSPHLLLSYLMMMLQCSNLREKTNSYSRQYPLRGKYIRRRVGGDIASKHQMFTATASVFTLNTIHAASNFSISLFQIL